MHGRRGKAGLRLAIRHLLLKIRNTLGQLPQSPDAVDGEDVEMLEDLLLTALRDAESKAEALTETHLSKYTKGLNLPGMF